MTKKQFTLFLDPAVIENIERIAKASHMDPKHYVALAASRLSDLKTEHALDALTAIPKEFFKGRPGRPLTSNEPEVAK